jgi:hypothetical protein
MDATVRTTHHRGESIRYVEASLDDVAIANKLTHECLGRSLDDLSPQTRRVLEAIDRLVTEKMQADDVERCEVRFSRRDALAVAGVSLTQLQLHLGRLVEHELVILHRQTHGLGFLYELAWSGEGLDGKPFLPGLIDVETLRAASMNGDLSGVKAGGVGRVQGANRPRIGRESAGVGAAFVDDDHADDAENSTSEGIDPATAARRYERAAE